MNLISFFFFYTSWRLKIKKNYYFSFLIIPVLFSAGNAKKKRFHSFHRSDGHDRRILGGLYLLFLFLVALLTALCLWIY